MNILVTGGCGYIGSHTVLELICEGHHVTVIDNLSHSKQESLKRVSELTNSEIPFYQADIRDVKALKGILTGNKFDCCILPG